ncbi:hypothetical protein A4A49_51973 [Nicotiana attenuata]|uniref:Uncharacterized protein n=1 Tax=Nicotiana attenuata TaxID=49451 RepID=A0A314KKL0_NICAT|nr:hypothetical protein A4A49_51973 [Nicotiana attenuata]
MMSQQKEFGQVREKVACHKKRKISDTSYDIIDVKELEKTNKELRATTLKKRYASVILKSQQQVFGKVFNEKEMKKKTELWEKQLREKKAKSQRQRDREAARIAIESIKRTVDFDDDM